MSADASTPIGTRPSVMAAVTSALRQAATTTGVSFNYLLATAKVESDLNPNLTMRSSTATGLFQFLEQTWLGVLKDTGSVLGYGRYANGIVQTQSGRYVVNDPALRSEIMELRKDPTANAVMGGAITQQNAALVARRIGRKPTEGELYVAHFFGPYAGSKVINLASTNPNAHAAAMFPRAAGANRPIFYDKHGNARSVAGVYGELVRRYQVALASAKPATTTVAATLAPNVAPRAVPSAPLRVAVAHPLALGNSLADGGSASSVQTTQAPIASDSSEPVFHSLFHSADRQGAVAPLVAQLWGAGATRTDVAPAAAVVAPRRVP